VLRTIMYVDRLLHHCKQLVLCAKQHQIEGSAKQVPMPK
jgi:hypothetical protein